jgi:hypothetical protein
MERVILVFNADGDILATVKPVDPLNPGFTEDKILNYPGINQVSTYTVESLEDFEFHIRAMLGG